MKIAVVAPSPSPYMIGGAEKLWWGLVGHLNSATAHQADLIKLPSPEADFWSLMDSYERFIRLDLSAFDVVITGKYPAWMVEHPHHVCYMLHRLRGLYDSYPGKPESPDESQGLPEIQRLRGHLRRTAGSRAGLIDCFGLLRDARQQLGAHHETFVFPGPLSHDIVHYLDGIGLAQSRIARFAAISQTVAARASYFPPGADVAVAYPPMGIATAPSDRQEHFFTISRLDRPKRVDVIVDAMQHVQANVPLLIAGTGPDEERLRRLAGTDERIHFLGYRGDAEIADLYARALAVPFVPYAEDYGLVTIEAMMAAKPIITSPDAGGPCELVANERTGLVVEATAAAVGAAMQRLTQDPQLARRLGAAGYEAAASVSWQSVVQTLLPSNLNTARRAGHPRPKLVIASTFTIYPPRHGGQSRIFHLYRGFARDFDCVIIGVGTPEQPYVEREIAPGLREISIPKSKEHDAAEKKIKTEVGVPVTDVVMPELYPLTPAIGASIAKEVANAAAVIASHPYMYPLLKRHARCPVWYESHNFEWGLKESVFSGSVTGRAYLDKVRTLERECCRNAELILLASAEDGVELMSAYDVHPGNFIAVANGTDCTALRYVQRDERIELKDRMGIGDTAMVLFMGSGHWPNIEAVQQIFGFAGKMPEVAFPIVGSVCYAFDPQMKPQNVVFLGEVDDITRDLMLECCDLALNPMLHGSGTNLKMLDYFAAGIPVISTDTGARGIGAHDGEHLFVREIEAFPDAIENALEQPPAKSDAMTQAARALVEDRFDWSSIANAALADIRARRPDLFFKTDDRHAPDL